MSLTDHEFFDQHLRSFIPPKSFDVHAHLHRKQDATPALPTQYTNDVGDVGWDEYCRSHEDYMKDLRPTGGLFFTIPKRDLEIKAANQFVLEETHKAVGSKALLMIRPEDEVEEARTEIVENGYAGFKVYHVFAQREKTFQAEPPEYIPEWAWELAHEFGLVIMLHMVRERAMADPINQNYIREHCLKYPQANLILAHAARGFNGGHTVEGIAALRGLSNVYFDTSAVCEAAPMEAILREFGPERLMFGSDFSVSDLVGRCVSIADGFIWLDEKNVDWKSSPFSQPRPVGLESLLAVKQACHTMRLNDTDVERIFCLNARKLLGLLEPSPVNLTQETYRKVKQLVPGGTQLLSKRPEMLAPEKWPGYYREARGCEVTDLDGRRYYDLSTSGIGSCILGFADPDVTDAVVRKIQMGSMSSLNCPEELELAELLTDIHPWAEQVRYCRTGGESMAAAIRIARAATGRDELAFCGYHGWSDWYLATNLPRSTQDQETGLDKHLLPGLSPSGVPSGLAETTHPFTYNNLEQLKTIIEERGDRLAAVVMEPTRYLAPEPGFLEGVRKLCDEAGVVLVLDEITTGWRFRLGGVHLDYEITPDIAIFAKGTSNGHPMGAIIGTRKVMEAAQNSFISSTYWTEGVGPTAALATIRKMEALNVSKHVLEIGATFKTGWEEIIWKLELPINVFGHLPLLHIGFDHEQAAELGTMFTVKMLDHGFLAGPGFYPTYAHQPWHVEAYLEAAEKVCTELKSYIEAGTISENLKSPVRHGGFARLTATKK